jgi:hypothetical protein
MDDFAADVYPPPAAQRPAAAVHEALRTPPVGDIELPRR